jgi:hypothetical protein
MGPVELLSSMSANSGSTAANKIRAIATTLLATKNNFTRSKSIDVLVLLGGIFLFVVCGDIVFLSLSFSLA